MKHTLILLLLSLCSTNISALDVVAEYSIESADHSNCLSCKRSINVDEISEGLFNSIVDGVNVLHNRSSYRRIGENDYMLYFVTCSLTKNNKVMGFASVLTSDDAYNVQKNNKICRSSVGLSETCTNNVLNLKENLSKIYDAITVDTSYIRTLSPFAS